MNQCVDEWNINLWMDECHINFTSLYKYICQMCFQCMILVCETYKLWMNKFCTISITKSWYVKWCAPNSLRD